ncbi:MAG: cadherin repeat domain-containing protein, partial [Alphaproteobacteria bacterium]|nr:cadherin repeat domain-containing protein [Alphaproteobacteria bacterium]
QLLTQNQLGASGSYVSSLSIDKNDNLIIDSSSGLYQANKRLDGTYDQPLLLSRQGFSLADDYFTIDNNGVVSLRSDAPPPLALGETSHLYTLTITAYTTDDVNHRLLGNTVLQTLVVNVGVTPPPFTMSSDGLSLLETNGINTPLTQFQAVDVLRQKISYSLDGLDKNYFSIDDSGHLLFVSGLDADNGHQSFYSITINARARGQAATVPYVLTIVNTNDNDITFTRNPTGRVISENTAIGTQATRYVAEDLDGQSVSYSLTGIDAGYFSIDDSAGTGAILRLRSVIDFENKAHGALYSVVVRGHSYGAGTGVWQNIGVGANQTSRLFIMSIQNIDDNDVTFVGPNARQNTISMQEYETGKGVILFSAMDGDVGQHISYTLDVGGDLFSLDQRGSVRLKKNVIPNNTYSLVVRAMAVADNVNGLAVDTTRAGQSALFAVKIVVPDMPIFWLNGPTSAPVDILITDKGNQIVDNPSMVVDNGQSVHYRMIDSVTKGEKGKTAIHSSYDSQGNLLIDNMAGDLWLKKPDNNFVLIARSGQLTPGSITESYVLHHEFDSASNLLVLGAGLWRAQKNSDGTYNAPEILINNNTIAHKILYFTNDKNGDLLLVTDDGALWSAVKDVTFAKGYIAPQFVKNFLAFGNSGVKFVQVRSDDNIIVATDNGSLWLQTRSLKGDGSGTYLYNDNAVKIVSQSEIANDNVRSFAFDSAGNIIVDGTNNLWIVSKNGSGYNAPVSLLHTTNVYSHNIDSNGNIVIATDAGVWQSNKQANGSYNAATLIIDNAQFQNGSDRYNQFDSTGNLIINTGTNGVWQANKNATGGYLAPRRIDIVGYDSADNYFTIDNNGTITYRPDAPPRLGYFTLTVNAYSTDNITHVEGAATLLRTIVVNVDPHAVYVAPNRGFFNVGGASDTMDLLVLSNNSSFQIVVGNLVNSDGSHDFIQFSNFSYSGGKTINSLQSLRNSFDTSQDGGKIHWSFELDVDSITLTHPKPTGHIIFDRDGLTSTVSDQVHFKTGLANGIDGGFVHELTNNLTYSDFISLIGGENYLYFG